MHSSLSGPLFRQEIERGERFHVETTARLEPKTRLVVSQGKIQRRTIEAVYFVAVISHAPQDQLRPAYDVLLQRQRSVFIRRFGEGVRIFQLRGTRRLRYVRVFLVVVIQVFVIRLWIRLPRNRRG